MRTPEG
jgi:hypothetical protein